MYYFYQASLLTCDCQQPCREIRFSKTISQALWPSAPFLPHLLNSIHASNRKTWVIRDKESAREDLVRLEVYFEDLSYNLVSEEEAYPIFQLLADTGGSLGLWVGLSLITVIEFLEFLLLVCQTLRHKERP
ncbi:acid-sensing ion channel 5-like [Ptychodera flava]|uniref:acid-sensing ion channel 5-like n=1 Tax=Ptychodera flava TaxID=63121 RepID=UPI00396A8493